MSTASITSETTKLNSLDSKPIKNNKNLLESDSQEQSLDFLNMLQSNEIDPSLLKADAKVNPDLEKQMLAQAKGAQLKMLKGSEAAELAKLTKPTEDKKVLLNQSQLEKLLNPKLNLAAQQSNQAAMQQNTAHAIMNDMSPAMTGEKNKLAGLKAYAKNMNNKNMIQEKISEHSLDSLKKINGESNRESQIGQQLSLNGSSHPNLATLDNKNLISDLAQQITNRIENSALYKATPMQSEINVELNHEELGHLSLNVKKHANDLEINVMTNHADAKNVLHENKDALISQLNSKGISVTDFNVDTFVGKTGDDTKLDTASKNNNSFNQQQDNKENLHQRNQPQGERERRDELWNILREQREVMHA